MKIRIPFILSFCIAVSGCAVAYIEPSTESSARLRLENGSARFGANFATYDDGEFCKDESVRRITIDASGNWEIAPNQVFNIRIRPDEFFSLKASNNQANLSCQVLVTFIPKKNTSYVAKFIDAPSKCYLAILRVVGNASDLYPTLVREESVRKRESVAGIANGGNSCK